MERKLAAIFSADVQGYSRLMGDDEEATVVTLGAYREIFVLEINRHRGRVVDAKGDAILAEFASVVDAVSCAVDIQRELAAKNAELPDNRRMDFRIGLNLGDVVVKDDVIYGDGVNIAARMESLAEGGGICISGTVYDSVKNKLPLQFEHLGEKQVKNITDPVRVYRVHLDAESSTSNISGVQQTGPRRWRKIALVTMLMAVIGLSAFALWSTVLRPSPPMVEVASAARMAFPLPDKPSIAVLPFDNMSGDPEQEYFSDGLTEDIITALSKTPRLFVIARHSVFTYKDKPVKVKQVAEDLGVRYVLEGSVRKADGQVRITAQLIDALTGGHLWAERYDRTLRDVFAVQDDIIVQILEALLGQLTTFDMGCLKRGTANLQAYETFLQGAAAFYHFTPEGYAQARQLFTEARALDPAFPALYVWLAWTDVLGVSTSPAPDQSLERASALAQQAIALDDTIGLPYSVLGTISLWRRQYEEAITQAARAVAIAPGVANGYIHLGIVLRYTGRHEDAIAAMKKGMRLNPIPPAWYLSQLGHTYRMAGQYEEAIAAYQRARHRDPDHLWVHMGLAATYALLGREEDAQAHVAEILRIHPSYSLEGLARSPYKNPADIQRYVDALRKAGLQ